MQMRMGEWVDECQGEGYLEEMVCDLNGQEKTRKNKGACVFREKSLSWVFQAPRHVWQLLMQQ